MPMVTVDVPRDDGAPTDLATLLARVGAAERRGLDPMCDGASCALCPPTGARCPCRVPTCGGKRAHTLQPCETRRGARTVSAAGGGGKSPLREAP